ALLRYMPPYEDGGEYRRIGLTNQWVITTALRASGIYNTPPIESLSLMSMPLQGSVWPEYGTLTGAEGLNGAAHAQFITAPWGYAAANFTATVIPNTSRQIPASEPVQLSMLRAPIIRTRGNCLPFSGRLVYGSGCPAPGWSTHSG